jgi:DNA-binding HxlR family transcriptional regulator
MTQHREWFTNDMCSVFRALEVLGERWTILVIREAFFGTRRFDDFQRNTGMARNILSNRLQSLVANGILVRRQYQERPVRFEYRLTQKGLDLYPALIALMGWGDRYTAGPAAGKPVVLEHRACGHETVPALTCTECGEPIDARAMRAKPGPGALAAG